MPPPARCSLGIVTGAREGGSRSSRRRRRRASDGRAARPGFGPFTNGESVCVSGRLPDGDSRTGGALPRTSRERLSAVRLSGAWTPTTPSISERALAWGDRLSGHFVLGARRRRHAASLGRAGEEFLDLPFLDPLRPLPVRRREGSVALDGVSLTVASRRAAGLRRGRHPADPARDDARRRARGDTVQFRGGRLRAIRRARLAAARRAGGESLLILYERSCRGGRPLRGVRGRIAAHRGQGVPLRGRSRNVALSFRSGGAALHRARAGWNRPDGTRTSQTLADGAPARTLRAGPGRPMLHRRGGSRAPTWRQRRGRARPAGPSICSIRSPPACRKSRARSLPRSSSGFPASRLPRARPRGRPCPGIPSGWIFPFVPGWTARTDTLEDAGREAAAAGRASWRRCRSPTTGQSAAPRGRSRERRALRSAKRASSSAFITAASDAGAAGSPGSSPARPARARPGSASAAPRRVP